jgi:serine/threonine-protein kinase
MMLAACPSDEVLARFLERLADQRERESVLSHLESCATCRLSVALLSEEPGPDAELPADAPLFEGSKLGPYRITRRLGAGAMGEVFLAIDERLGREVAIKRLRRQQGSPEARKLLLEEARGLARLNHPNIVGIFDVGEVGPHLWLTMEYVAGDTVGAWLRTRPSSAAVLEVFRQAAQGLGAAHARGVVHHDVKPANLLLGQDGRVRVSDFGLAAVDGVSRALGGTPGYMAPEQRAGLPTTAAADQYAFCVALAEGLTGQRPGDGAALTWPAELPPTVRVAVERGLSASPEARFPSMEALAQALAPVPPAPSRRATRLAVAVGVLLMVLGALMWSWSPTRAQVLASVSPQVVVLVASQPDEQLRSAAGLFVPMGGRGYVLSTARLAEGAVSLGALRFKADEALYAPAEGGAGRWVFEHQQDLVGARLVRSDPVANLALFELAGDAGVSGGLPFGGSVSTGDEVLVVGHPGGVLWSSVAGSVSAVRGNSLQLDLKSVDGLAGAPVVDGRGRVVGLVTAEGAGGVAAVSAERAQALLTGVAEPFVADRSTPEKTVKSCLRALELGQAEAWVDCFEAADHWKLHQQGIEWALDHATVFEAHQIRDVLERRAPDWRTEAHVLAEVRQRYGLMLSHAPPQVKAQGKTIFFDVSAQAPLVDSPDDSDPFLESVAVLQRGVRVEQTAKVSDDTSWVLLSSRGADERAVFDSVLVVRCGARWCLQGAVPEAAEALRPPNFPERQPWAEQVAASGARTLEAWRAIFTLNPLVWW